MKWSRSCATLKEVARQSVDCIRQRVFSLLTFTRRLSIGFHACARRREVVEERVWLSRVAWMEKHAMTTYYLFVVTKVAGLGEIDWCHP